MLGADKGFTSMPLFLQKQYLKVKKKVSKTTWMGVHKKAIQQAIAESSSFDHASRGWRVSPFVQVVDLFCQSHA